MTIAILGTGNMARALGLALIEAGHAVTIGGRDAGKAAAAAAEIGAEAAGLDDAAEGAEIVIWTMREPDPAAVLADPAGLSGKVVIDLNNRDYAEGVKGGAWFEAALAERLQAAAPGARVVKAFNTIAMEAFATDPARLREAGAQTFIAGDDAAAKARVAALAADIGWEAVDLGTGPAAMRAAEALGDAIRLAMIEGGHGWQVNLRLEPLPEPDRVRAERLERRSSTYS